MSSAERRIGPVEHGSPTIDEQLRFAIANRRLIRVSYQGKPRVAEPHDYGLQKGVAKLLIYQQHEPGAAWRPGVSGWRLFELPKIDACVVLDETFHGSRGASHQLHYTWDVLFARVE